MGNGGVNVVVTEQDGFLSSATSFSTSSLHAGSHVITLQVTDGAGVVHRNVTTLAVGAAPSAACVYNSDCFSGFCSSGVCCAVGACGFVVVSGGEVRQTANGR